MPDIYVEIPTPRPISTGIPWSIHPRFIGLTTKFVLYKTIVREPDMSNSIETAIAIAFFGTIAIDIAIAKAIFQLLLLLLVLLRQSQTYCS